MCNPGVKERDDKRFAGAWNGGLEMFRAYRKAGAPIGFAPDPRTGHECGDSLICNPVVRGVLGVALASERGEEQKLRAIDQTKAGWPKN